MCTYCGKRHLASCALRIHSDANDDITIECADSAIGKAILAAGYRKSGIEMRMRWTINVLIDTGCLQPNVVSARVVALLRQDEKIMRNTGVQPVSGVGGLTYGVERMMDATVSLKSTTLGIPKLICLRVFVCNDVTTDLIIGLPLWWLVLIRY